MSSLSSMRNTSQPHSATFCLALLQLAIVSGCQQRDELAFDDLTLASTEIIDTPLPADAGPRLVGVASCTASGCHGAGKPGQVVGSEYNIWITKDPHASAFSVLYDEASIRMLQLLDGKSNVAPYQDARCTNCHSTTFAEPRDEGGSVYTDGVGCEACHGPAERWLGPHVTGHLAPTTRAELGIWNTDQLTSRTKICADCHVGGTNREVNHDLIAAGHPRLQFEMGAYLEALPKHWDENRDRQGLHTRFDALTWAIGQVVTSQAALEQLGRRAASSEFWPELSEWSCSACHHDLRDDQVRQRSLSTAGNLSGRAIAWDDWNHFLTRHYLQTIEESFELSQSGGQAIETELAALQELVQSTRSDRKSVSEKAFRLAAKLAAWSDALERTTIDQRALDRLSFRILSSHFDHRHLGWESAALVYDAIASMHQSRLEYARAAGKADDVRLKELTGAIRELYEQLSIKPENASAYHYYPSATDNKIKAVLVIVRKLDVVQEILNSPTLPK